MAYCDTLSTSSTTGTAFGSNYGPATTTSAVYVVPVRQFKPVVMLRPKSRYNGDYPSRKNLLEGKRHGYQQMCRLPNYRGSRVR